MRILTLSMLVIICCPVFAGSRLLSSYGIKTWGVGGFRYIASFSHLYGDNNRDFSFVKYASASGRPEIRVFTAAKDNGIDAVYLQARLHDTYEYLREVTGEEPPVKRIDVYLVPCGYNFEIVKKSFAFMTGVNLSFAFAVSGNGDGCHLESMSLTREIVRTLAHEVMHTILNFHHPDQTLGERAAVTIESCAELAAFGDTAFAKRVRLGEVADDQRDAPINISLSAKYEDDEKLASISSYGPLSVMNAEGTDKLFVLCRERYQQALRSAR